MLGITFILEYKSFDSACAFKSKALHEEMTMNYLDIIVIVRRPITIFVCPLNDLSFIFCIFAS